MNHKPQTDAKRNEGERRWPHRIAVAMVCATFPLIWVGGLVTTYDAGMAVEDWPTTWGYNLFLYPWTTWLFGPFDLFIEHGHRLLGALVGLLTIALVISVFLGDARPWMRRLAVAALVMVVFQGVLGGFRVLMDQRTLAMIHGCVAPLFFALCVVLAVVTSRMWRDKSVRWEGVSGGSLHRMSIATSVVIYLQLLLGAQLRHVSVTADPLHFRLMVFLHLVMAAVVVAHATALAWTVLRHYRRRVLVLPCLMLGLLIAAQIALGGATWVVKYAWPAWARGYWWSSGYTIQANGMTQSLIVTAHVAVGSLIFVTAVMLALRAWRLVPRHSMSAGRGSFRGSNRFTMGLAV